MPWSALPDHLNIYKNPDAWKGTDDDNVWMRWRIKIKGWFAYGPRAIEWWARWRKCPITLLAMFGPGDSRWENDFMAIRSTNESVFLYKPKYSNQFYLSRIQYWCDWHFQIQWPLYFGFHIKFNNKMIFGYIGAHRDADMVYWFPSFFLGMVWK